MLIFGTSSKMLQLAMLNLLCSFCGNPSAHALRKRVIKFSLFFIPLFPIAPPKHFLQCTFCGGTSEVTKENAEQMLAQAGVPGPGQQQPQPNPYQQAPGQMPPQGDPYQAAPGQTPPPGNPYRS